MTYDVLVTRKIFQEGIDVLIRNGCRVDVNPADRVLTRDELIEQIENVDGVLSQSSDTLDKTILEASSRVRIFSNFAVGFNNIDIPTATRLGIMITNTPGVLTDATADLAWALLFATARRIAEGDRFTRAGRFKTWGPLSFLGADVTGKTLGILGAGRIGTAMALRSSGFRMKVVYYDTVPNEPLERRLPAKRIGLDDLLKKSDFVSVHVPLIPETVHLIGGRELGLMKKSAFLINTSRGPVVDEKALVQALKTGTIAGAGLDVYENEPALEPGLTELENVVLSPHIGSATKETRIKMGVLAAENLVAGLKGIRPPNLVNAEVWDSPVRRRHG